eukprot:520531-Amphidinium_carterae.1
MRAQKLGGPFCCTCLRSLATESLSRCSINQCCALEMLTSPEPARIVLSSCTEHVGRDFDSPPTFGAVQTKLLSTLAYVTASDSHD